MILKQINDIRIAMLHLDPDDLVYLLNKYIPELIVKDNNDRTINITYNDGDVRQYIDKINTCILRWIGEAGFDFPVQMLYETFNVSFNTIIIKV